MQLDTAAVSHYSEIDIVLTVLVSIMMTLGTIVGFFIRDRMKTYDAQIAKNAALGQSVALLDQRVVQHDLKDDTRFADLKHDMCKNTELTAWVGDCLVATRTGDPMPPRPK